MYTFVKNTLIAFTLSTSLVLANDKTTAIIDIDMALPKKILTADVPLFSHHTSIRSRVQYGPNKKRER